MLLPLLSRARVQARAASRTQTLRRGVFPRPYSITRLPHRDITMQNVPGEGDFEHYQVLLTSCGGA